MKLSKSTTTDEFIQMAKIVHGDAYDYSKSVYTSRTEKVIIICKNHGPFLQAPNLHIQRQQKCPQCAKDHIKSINPPKRLISEFITEANTIHNNKYDYSKVITTSTHSKATIICPNHGAFTQTIINHLKGAGCPQCAIEARANSIRKSAAEFFSQASTIHNEKYSYLDYTDDRTLISIQCPEHGTFTQLPNSHLNGKGCPKCGFDKIRDSQRIPFDEIITRANALHNGTYEYSEKGFTDTKGHLKIKCKEHGWFVCSVSNHLAGSGCKKCGSSHFQKSVGEFIESIGLPVEFNNRDLLFGKELDLVVLEKRFAIECDGLYWHSYDRPESREERYKHHIKHTAAANAGIRLLSIREDEWKNKQKLIKSMIKHRLNLSSDKIFARDCKIKVLPNNDVMQFINEHHLSGFRHAKFNYCLLYNDRLVAVMSFSRHAQYGYEIIRYCAESGTAVIGGASKLFTAFKRDNNPRSIISYADRRISNGGLYRKLGFQQLSITGPNYSYVKGHQVYSRQHFQRHKLQRRLQVFDPSLTESSNMFANGYRRIWDAGHFKFLWNYGA